MNKGISIAFNHPVPSYALVIIPLKVISMEKKNGRKLRSMNGQPDHPEEEQSVGSLKDFSNEVADLIKETFSDDMTDEEREAKKKELARALGMNQKEPGEIGEVVEPRPLNITLGVKEKEKRVCMKFSFPIDFIDMKPEDARVLARELVKIAWEVDKKPKRLRKR